MATHEYKIEIFERVRKHMLTQNQRSADEQGECKYRDDQGLMCAVGCLIADHAYGPHIEGTVASDYLVQQALRLSGIQLDDDIEFILHELQQIHDWRHPDCWEKELLHLESKIKEKPSV